MKLKERGRYTVLNPEAKSEKKQEGEDSNEYTDGFFSSDSDTFVPHEANRQRTESDLV